MESVSGGDTGECCYLDYLGEKTLVSGLPWILNILGNAQPSLPNSPMFSPTNVFCYTAYIYTHIYTYCIYTVCISLCDCVYISLYMADSYINNVHIQCNR